jgi:hypothetical protein
LVHRVRWEPRGCLAAYDLYTLFLHVWCKVGEERVMTSLASRYCLLGSLAVLGLTVAAQATPSLNLLGDTGSLVVTTYSPVTRVAVATLTDPYGTPLPAITPVTGGWAITLSPTAEFLATANNAGGGKTTVMDGQLSFYVTFDSPVSLTTTLYEDGIWITSGNGTVNVNGGMVVSEADNTPTSQSHSNNFPAVTFNNSGYWSLSNQVSGFNNTFTKYKISIDNTLLAESLMSESSGSAYIAKKDFTLILNTDGGGVPEPSSLGVLATGCLALLARRRRV